MLNIYEYYTNPESLPGRAIALKRFIMDDFPQPDDEDEYAFGNNIDDVIKHIGRVYQIEDWIIDNVSKGSIDPSVAVSYAIHAIHGRIPQLEKIISTIPNYALRYAADVLANDPSWTKTPGHENGRWPEAEQKIKSYPWYAYQYAKNIIKGRWEDAESIIKADPAVWNKYKETFKVE